MPAKKAAKAKAKAAKPAKPAKVAKAASGKSLLNKAAKQVASKISAVVKAAKAKPAAKPVKVAKAAPVKAAKLAKALPAKKIAAVDNKKKTAAPVAKVNTKVQAPAKGKALPQKATAQISLKGQKLDAKAKGKAKNESVIEVEVSSLKIKGKEVKGKKADGAGGKVKEVRKRCKEPACDSDPLLLGFCRMHYIKNWRKIKRKEAILATGQLNNYVEELVNKYPDKYLDVIRQDLASEKDWSKVVVDLELESAEDDLSGEDEVEAAAEGGTRRDRDFDDDSDAF